MKTKKINGVKIIDAETMMTYEFKAKIIFVCASSYNFLNFNQNLIDSFKWNGK